MFNSIEIDTPYGSIELQFLEGKQEYHLSVPEDIPLVVGQRVEVWYV